MKRAFVLARAPIPVADESLVASVRLVIRGDKITGHFVSYARSPHAASALGPQISLPMRRTSLHLHGLVRRKVPAARLTVPGFHFSDVHMKREACVGRGFARFRSRFKTRERLRSTQRFPEWPLRV